MRLTIRGLRATTTLGRRVSVADGQGTRVTYPWNPTVGPGDDQWLHQARTFLAEQKGDTRSTVQIERRTTDGAIVVTRDRVAETNAAITRTAYSGYSEEA